MNVRLQWQFFSPSYWALGEMTRGVVRNPIAECYELGELRWKYIIRVDGQTGSPTIGHTATLHQAIDIVEADPVIREMLGLPPE